MKGHPIRRLTSPHDRLTSSCWRSRRNHFQHKLRRHPATSDTDIERIVKPISSAPFSAACSGANPFSIWREILERIAHPATIAADPELAAFDGDRHGEIVAQFVEIEERSRAAAVSSIRARHQAAIPRGALGEMRVIRGEIGRKRAHMPLRKLMKAAGGTIQKIKPVFLMSPLSVAQFLPPGSVDFDLLVIDGASQLRPEDALGLVARCRQIVVVGDKKQLPPTSFFDRMIADEADSGDGEETAIQHGESAAPITDLESILSLCEARGLESRMLRWHCLVAAHPSLIEVSHRGVDRSPRP
jgi:hypothetical protein